MGKKSKTRSIRYEKDQSGCMWGLISLLHFRNGRFSRKLLPDSGHGTKQAISVGYLKNSTNCDEDCQNIHDDEKSMTSTAEEGKPCVKKLIDEDMINERDSKKDNGHGVVEEQSQSDNGHRKKNRRRKNNISRKSGDLNTKDVDAAGHSCRQKTQKKYPNNLDTDALMEEFCSQIHQKSISCEKHVQHNELNQQAVEKNSGYEEKLCKAIELFISQKYCNAENLPENRKLLSEQLMAALQVLGSDKEIFLKLKQDPNSLLLKYIQISEGAKIPKEKSKSFRGPRSEHEISTSEQTEEPLNRKHHNFFRRRVKSQENISFHGDENPHARNRIIILKPGPTLSQNPETSFGSLPKSSFNIGNKGNEKVASHFSLTEIKRKLKHAMGKERHGNFGKFILEKSPTNGVVGENVERKLTSKDHFFLERHVKPPVSIQRGDKTSKPVDCEISTELQTTGYSKHKVSNIYAEVKKHISEMLSNRYEDQGCSNRRTMRTLGRTLSLPDFNYSPIDSPGRDCDHGIVTAQMRLSTFDKVSRDDNTLQLRQIDISYQDSLPQNIETQTNCSGANPNDKVEALNSDSKISEEAIYSDPNISDDSFQDNMKDETLNASSDEFTSEGYVEKVTDTPFQVDVEILAASPGTSSSPVCRNEQDGHSPNFDHNGYSEHLEMDSSEENQLQCSSIASPPSSSIRKKYEYLESDIELERPSPVSVLENLFAEDEISPARTIRQPVELRKPTLQSQFEEQDSSGTNHDIYEKTCFGNKEMLLGYINAVLEASGLSWDDLYIRSLSSDQILDSSLLDEVQFPCNQLFHEQRMLFDCINEVLLEVCEHHFGCLPWVSFVKPRIGLHPNMTNILHDIWEGIYWHLLPQPLPHSLDQIIRKDMEKNGKWMYLRFDTESIGIDFGEEILEELIQELIEDTMSSFVDELIESGSPALPEELKENESRIIWRKDN